MNLDNRWIKPLDKMIVRLWRNAAIGLAVLGLITALVEPVKAVDKPEKVAKSITYTGVVLDRITEKPIEGATVIIERTHARPRRGVEARKKVTEVKTDASGNYSFTLGPDEASEYYLIIEVAAHHPEYVAKGKSGYAHVMILKNLKLGVPPLFAKIRLWPGKAVTGTVVSPDGRPVAGVQVMAYSRHAKSKQSDFDGFFTTHTDVKGRFRFVAATPGVGVYWITPKGFAPQALVIPEKRGDLGRVTLQHGSVITGKVLDAKGKPVANVRVEAWRRGNADAVDRALGQHSVGYQIRRNSVTNGKGEFQLDEVSAGEYELNLSSPLLGWADQPLDQVFIRRTITLRDAEKPAPLEIRAVPHFEIRVKWLDSQGKPTGGWRFTVVGRMDKVPFGTQSGRVNPKTGQSVARVPRGLRQTRVEIFSNEHGSLRWRLKPGDRLQSGRRIDLGTLDADYQGLEVIRYVAPILFVKVVDEKGKLVRGFKTKAVYENGQNPKESKSRLINSNRGDVYFQKQTDGRWRSSQLLPDQKLIVTTEVNDYTTTAQSVVLKEGATRELVFVMKRKPAETNRAVNRKKKP